MPGRPARPKPTPAQLESRILDALRAAGGSSQRNNLRSAIRPVITTEDFDRSVSELIARGELEAEMVTLTWRSHRGMDLPYHVIVYALVKERRRRAAPTIKPGSDRGSRPRQETRSFAEIEVKVLAALREAGGSKGRSALRTGISPRLPLATFDAAIANLVDRRLIKAKEIKSEDTGQQKNSAIPASTLYSLTSAGKKAR